MFSLEQSFSLSLCSAVNVGFVCIQSGLGLKSSILCFRINVQRHFYFDVRPLLFVMGCAIERWFVFTPQDNLHLGIIHQIASSTEVINLLLFRAYTVGIEKWLNYPKWNFCCLLSDFGKSEESL